MDIQQNNVAVLHFNLVNQDGSTIFIRKTKLATFNLINPSEVSVPITDIGFDATLNQCWVRISKASNAATGQYYGVLNIVDDDWGTYTTSKIKVYSVVSDADEDTKSVVFTATCLATQITNPSGGNSPYYNTTTETWWQYSDTLKAFEDTGVGNLIKYITKNVQHLKDGTGNGSVVTCLDDEISANNIATGLCSTDFGKNNDNRGESCVALGENNYIAEGVSNAIAIAGARPSIVDVFVVGDKTAGNKNVFEIDKFGNIHLRPDSSQERTAILQDILDRVIKNVFYDSSKYSLTVTFYSAADNANKTKTYDLSGLKAVLKDDAVKEISVNQSTAVMTVDTINGSSKQIQLPTAYLPLAGGTLTGDLLFSNSGTTTRQIGGTVGDNDFWRIAGGAPAIDLGWLEIATGNNGIEPIYVRQYGGGGFSGTIVHSATLLDASGNTSFPGTVTASAFSGNASSATTATKLDGYYTTHHYDNPTSGGFYGHDCIPVIDSGGVMEVGKYIDFHTSSTLLDYATRIICNSATSNEVSLPLSSGALALTTDNVASATKLANARTITLTGNTTGSGSFDGSANLSIATTTSYATAAGKLNTARNIGLSGVTSTAQSFDGSANITIPITAVPATLLTGTASISTTGNAATATKLATARSITLSGDTTGTATFDGSDNITIDTIGSSSIQPFDLLDSNEQGTFWTQTGNTNSIAVAFMTDSKFVTNKVRIFIDSTAGANIRCAIYKKESSVLSLVTHTQLYTGHGGVFVDIPFETITTLDSDALYYLVVERGSSDLTFLGKQIKASLLNGFVYAGDAFNADDTFKSQYPTDGPVDGNVFVPYFKII